MVLQRNGVLVFNVFWSEFANKALRGRAAFHPPITVVHVPAVIFPLGILPLGEIHVGAVNPLKDSFPASFCSDQPKCVSEVRVVATIRAVFWDVYMELDVNEAIVRPI